MLVPPKKVRSGKRWKLWEGLESQDLPHPHGSKAGKFFDASLVGHFWGQCATKILPGSYSHGLRTILSTWSNKAADVVFGRSNTHKVDDILFQINQSQGLVGCWKWIRCQNEPLPIRLLSKARSCRVDPLEPHSVCKSQACTEVIGLQAGSWPFNCVKALLFNGYCFLHSVLL